MRHFLLYAILTLPSLFVFSQKKQKFAAEINYGVNGNFFVSNSTYGGPGGPSTRKFYKKNFLGSIGGIELKYNTGKNSRLGIAYSKSVNKKEIDYAGNFINVGIRDWNITHTNIFFQFYYERDLSKSKPAFKYHAGIFYLRMKQQEIDIGDYVNGGILYDERNFKKNKLEEGGVFAGIHYSKKIDTKFDLGIKARLYYLISTNSFEAITLTPTLTYHF